MRGARNLMLWCLFAFAFLGLVGTRIATAQAPAKQLAGSAVMAATDPKTRVAFSARVLRADTDKHGNRVVKLQVEGTLDQPTLVIPPGLYVQKPRVGSTLRVTARPLGEGAFTLDHSADLTVLTPGYRSDVADGSAWIPVENLAQAPTLTRFHTAALVVPTRTTQQGHMQGVLLDARGDTLCDTLVLKGTVRELRPRSQRLYGYFTPEGTLVIEGIH